MDSTEDSQLLEITALQSIYAEDFIECPPPKAWKGAARLHEFIIRVSHPEPIHASKIHFNLHVKFPKTYPRLACPTFTIEKPIVGINEGQVSRLSQEVNSEAQKLKGFEMVFSIITFCQDWIEKNITPPVEVVGSLALQMTQRAQDEERARRQREIEQAAEEEERATRAAEELNEQIQADAMRQMMAKEQQYKARKRANSEATEVPATVEIDTPTETFRDMEINGVKFNTVRVFHPRVSHLGLVYMADPVVDDFSTATPLELYVVTFEEHYYTTSQGRKKLTQLESEIKNLINIRHTKLLTIYGVKLHLPSSSGSPQLMVLTEQTPALTLHDVLEDCDSLREDRASDYIAQILTALNALHCSGLVHKGITTRCIGLTSTDNPSQPKTVKISKAPFHTYLLDLHRSNSFGPHTPPIPEEPKLPEGWLSRDVNESALLYTRKRDIHDVGIVFMQMLLGLDVCERYSEPGSAIHSSSISPTLARQIMLMLEPPKKGSVTCASLLTDLNGVAQSPVTNPRTPLTLPYGSPEGPDYFRLTPREKQTSRWKTEWEELELLGRGAFGSVVKARNKIDSRIYAVKKVRLSKTPQNDKKIEREVDALSRLFHRNIVRYYTTWIEVSDPTSAAASGGSSTESSIDEELEEGLTSVPGITSEKHLPVNGQFQFNVDDFDDISVSRGSFPSIHFSVGSDSGGDTSSSSEDDDEFGGLFKSTKSRSRSGPASLALNSLPPDTPAPQTTLYIQMEFVERQTLKERVDEGLPADEKEGWRLFQQIVDALVHMSTMNILHRDIKLTNIFIDIKGDCKVGDFGLATSSLSVDPSDVSASSGFVGADMTLEVGTRLYIAPEVQSHRRVRGPRDHSKADMYSLGIVFFEMNFQFNTGAERIAVLEDLRKPSITFPAGWDPHRIRQKEIITWLLQHDPDKRPTALELSQSPLLPERLEDEYFKNALRLMAKPDTTHHQTALATLFKQPPRLSRAVVYDQDVDSPDYAPLNQTVQDQLVAIFHLHGAVDMEPPLLMPIMDPEEEKNQATFIDRQGDIVSLPNNILVPFARLAGRQNIRRIKRYHITNVYRPNTVPGHPKFTKAALFDIISPDLRYGPLAAGAEIISVVNDCLDTFPNLSQNYDIHISHSKIIEVALNRVPAETRAAVAEILNQPKSSIMQKRALLLKKGLVRSTADELEILSDVEEDLEETVLRLEKLGTGIATILEPWIKEVRQTIQYTQSAGVKRQIYFHPLMLGAHNNHFKDGIMVEVVRRNKQGDVLAAGGRYDNLITRFQSLKQKPDPVCAFGIQIAVEKITAALASYQSASIKTLVKEERSFGFWSPRRCDVYVVSYQAGYLQERLEVVSYLWEHNISADLMYESGLPDAEHENHLDICAREGILFTVYPRPRTGRNLPAFKVKSILKGTEVDLSRQELVSWLQHQIADQKRVDAATSGATTLPESAPNLPVIKDTAVVPDVQLVLPDPKKQRKQMKQLFLEKAFEKALAIKNSFQNGMPVLVVDVSPAHFDAMIRSSAWVTDEEAWKVIWAMFPPQHSGYAQTVREAAIKRKSEGHSYILLYGIREDRTQLLSLAPN
ncbi:eIF-2-alpha kinase GCN2 [Psilocybe cubensis]|uniref:non-specific serine/threonine protein kinase n=2 Tax=Psilocybe cubensis TaxID=181762 RepID=A0A8H7YBH2_PSICU|nr:eIF-2-alpha kinase GCN2 [Psilocybe cubensis]KAH9487410.1 eIF-2-alpha kinase GCN2 [Psilocybe cubensis]